MKTKSNYQDLLKLIAIITMIIDHLGLYFYPQHLILRIIGRLSMPIFCFFAGYNFSQRPRHLILLLGIVLFLVDKVIFGEFHAANILISIYIGQWYILLFHNQLKKFNSGYLHIVLTATLFSFTHTIIEYGTLVITVMILGYMVQYNSINKKLAIALAMLLTLVYTYNVFFAGLSVNKDIFAILAVPVLGYLLMVAQEFPHQINLKLNILTRNALIIYFLQAIIFQCIWGFFLLR